MTELRIYATRGAGVEADRDSAVAAAPEALLSTSNAEQISAQLKTRGIKFQRWPSKPKLEQGAMQEQILEAYASLIASVQKNEGYQTVDVMRVERDQISGSTLRQTFRQEHQHAEDEVRFFVEGCGLFALHIKDEVLQVICEANDWIAIPAGTRHWFDMGVDPNYCVIRFFKNSGGWAASFTHDPIADHYPGLDQARKQTTQG
ncbi:acireductone dioxygenase [Synechococcus sp. CC9311]|uniref:Acireductone dioxygenase n=1 Tax=Synechococcus sp. (strain CC9311) TaxID=64471 RepID=MTND_SYNS3|nr:acireductone dioxygenase [Synechococcus sp. CC9311]Q0ICL5.1 RecName: Full=Acireductone dioxygenase; AltName: Full=1,2-dihydroxy-3-keto-5-methylthiopentene dioxygenase; Short=DHK-MTPene dioxygenase; AltName: Full=Acireductone dioxygenase (Fe(2+)-requiring); Short=ARD'; Short=Fe-ARD; AltName: Full=Acireductone dioxygenase (Ni(2+)-requiring); Short=ARD; Short=Ni-ARD [Synechococcus sp. CC9311]ABI47203.1 ARD/ARD' family protein [Synechococcus sp. CC9311]